MKRPDSIAVLGIIFLLPEALSKYFCSHFLSSFLEKETFCGVGMGENNDCQYLRCEDQNMFLSLK